MSLASNYRIRSDAVNQVDIHYSRVIEMVETASKEGHYYIDVDFGKFEMPPHVTGSLELMLREKGFIVAHLETSCLSPSGYMMRVNW